MQDPQEMQFQSLDPEDPLEEEMATHSSILAWKISRTEEPGRLQSMGLQESDTTEHVRTNVMVRLSNAVRVERGQYGFGKRENHMKNVAFQGLLT